MNRYWVKFLPTFVSKRLEGRWSLQGIIGNTGWLFADKVVRLGIGLFVAGWVARYLGPEQYGMLSYAQAFVLLFSAIANLGLNGIVVRNLVRDSASSNVILGTAFFLKLCSSIFTFVLIVILAIFIEHDNNLSKLMITLIAASLIFQVSDVIDYWYQSKTFSRPTVIARILAFFVSTVIKIILIVNNLPVSYFAAIALIDSFISALGLYVAYYRSGYRVLNWKISKSVSIALLKDSWPLILSGMVILLYMRIDQIMLAKMVGAKALGIYSTAVTLAEVWYFVPMIVVPSVFPKIIEAKQIDDELFYSRLQQLYKLMALLAYIIAVPVSLLSGWIVNLIYGPLYSEAGPMLALLVWAGLFTNIGVARSSFLTTMNWTKVHLVTTLMGGVINVVLNLILIPKYEGLGAVIASLVAYGFQSYVSCFFYKPLRQTGIMLTKAIFFPNPFLKRDYI